MKRTWLKLALPENILFLFRIELELLLPACRMKLAHPMSAVP